VSVKVIDPLLPVYGAESVEKARGGEVLRLVGPGNGVCSAQAVVVGEGLEKVTATITALRQGDDVIPAEAIRIRYAAREQGYAIGNTDQRKGHTHRAYIEPYYDILHARAPADSGVTPVWVTVEIPAGAAPGEYAGTLRIGPEAVPVKLTVAPWLCPAPGAMETHVGMVPSTESLSRHYGVEDWSEAHWKLIEEELRLLGGIGSDDLWVHTLWHEGYNRGKTALLRFRRDGEKIVPDFSVLDRYLKLYRRHCSKPQFVIVMVWTGEPRGRKGRPGKPLVDVVVDGEKTAVPRVYAPGGAEIWKAALDGIRARVKGMGWDEESIVLGLAGDQRPSKEEVGGFKAVGPYGRWAVWTHGRGEAPYHSVKAGEKYVFTNGMEVVYYAHPYTPNISGWIRGQGKVHKGQVEGGILGGWRMPVNVYTTTRNDLHKYHALTQWRAYPTGTCIGGYGIDCEAKGFTFIWFDWFTDANGYTPFICRVCDVMSRKNSPALIAAGPDGPLGTVRYETFREGIQEAEARRVVEKALVEGRLKGPAADAARAVLEAQIEIRFRKGEFSGGHAGGNLGKPERMWGFAPWPEWQANTLRLFEAAAVADGNR
jgi:hypothetical protein